MFAIKSLFSFSRLWLCTICMVNLFSIPVLASTSKIIDCPLRDEPFSLKTPLLDILLSDKSRLVLEKHLPGLDKKVPPMVLKTEAPAFGAIVSMGGVARMLHLSEDKAKALEADLSKLEVTDYDRELRCSRYDDSTPTLSLPDAKRRVLIFNKINGFDHGASVTAATQAVSDLVDALGWGAVVTDNGAVFTHDNLSQFDLVVWNNNSGDVLTLSQRQAFESYIENGGGYLGIHGAGGDSIYYWDWYARNLLGAQFIGHPMSPQFQMADVRIEANIGGIADDLRPGWRMSDEWYSFAESPRKAGANIIATLDESSYEPGEVMGKDLHMGEDHPIAWTRCVENGRSFYTAIGHRPAVYNNPENLMLLRDGLIWAAGEGRSICQKGVHDVLAK